MNIKTSDLTALFAAMDAAAADASVGVDVAAESKRLTNAIRRCARKAQGWTALSAADEKAGRNRRHYRRECERLIGIVREARDRLAAENNGATVETVEIPAVSA